MRVHDMDQLLQTMRKPMFFLLKLITYEKVFEFIELANHIGQWNHLLSKNFHSIVYSQVHISSTLSSAHQSVKHYLVLINLFDKKRQEYSVFDLILNLVHSQHQTFNVSFWGKLKSYKYFLIPVWSFGGQVQLSPSWFIFSISLTPWI